MSDDVAKAAPWNRPVRTQAEGEVPMAPPVLNHCPWGVTNITRLQPLALPAITEAFRGSARAGLGRRCVFSCGKPRLPGSLDSMTGACSRLRGDDMISVIEDGEMTVLAFAPPRRFEEQALGASQIMCKPLSLKRSENLAADILAMDDKVPYSGDSTNRVQTLERQLLEKDLNVRFGHSQDISELHMELHAAARQVASFSRNRRPERPEDENLKELSFLRRQCNSREGQGSQQWPIAQHQPGSREGHGMRRALPTLVCFVQHLPLTPAQSLRRLGDDPTWSSQLLQARR
eukprot:g17043.t1